MYEAREVRVEVGGREHVFRADLRAYMNIHELIRGDRDLMRHVVRREGDRPDGEIEEIRMRMTPENLPDYLAAVGDTTADEWRVLAQTAHPEALMTAWIAADNLLGQAQADWEKDDESPFRHEPEQPVAVV